MCPATNKSSDTLSQHLVLRLKPKIHAQLVELAERNERTVSAEIRLAIREHLERQPAAA